MQPANSLPFALVAVDVGYGNVKALSFAPNTGARRQLVMPVGAAPASKAAKSLHDGSIDTAEGALVDIAGETWVAGVSPLSLQTYARPTDANYPKTPEYLALYYAALSRLDVAHIPVLVTGLPVKQFYRAKSDGDLEHLKRRLQGTHHLSPGRRVTVERVVVLPQPIGAYTDLLQREPELNANKDSHTLVVDIGYYSTDWVLARQSNIMDAHSGTSTDATSVIIETAARQISEANGGVQFSTARIESALREGRETMMLGHRLIDLNAFIASAAAGVAANVLKHVNRDLRTQDDLVDLIAITGGGARLLERPFRAAFPGSRITVSTDSVLANARGFLWWAQSYYHQLQKQAG